MIKTAERRMFAKTIIDSDAFLDMPLSSQALYFHLSMRADDDGFINNPKKIQRVIGCSDDDLKLLIAKRFIIPFESGIVVVKHWRIHNYIQRDRYKPTVYQEELARLTVKDNKAYTLDTGCIHDGYGLETQVRLGKDSLGKDRLIISSSNEDVCPSEVKDEENKDALKSITTMWNTLTAYGIKPIRSIVPESERHRLLRARFRQYGDDSFAEIVDKIKESDFLQGKNNKGWTVSFDWVIRPNNYPKVLEGNYDNRNNVFGNGNKSKLEQQLEAMKNW